MRSIDYILNHDSNRYDQVGQTFLTYDSSGSLTFDGQYVYVYDYLYGLCDVREYWVFPQAKSAGPRRFSPRSTWPISFVKPYEGNRVFRFTRLWFSDKGCILESEDSVLWL